MRYIKFVLALVLLNGLFLAQVRAETNVSETEEVKPAEVPKGSFSDLRVEAVPVKVQKVIDPLVFLGDDGALYEFVGLDIPPGDEIVEEATKTMKSLLTGKELRLFLTKSKDLGRMTRTGHKLIHAEVRPDDVWVQGKLLAEGLARVRVVTSNPEMVKQMLAIEEKARSEKRGLWADPRFAVFSPDAARSKINSFQIVEGEVYSVSTRDNEMFVNFDTDWKKDFSIGIPQPTRRELSKLFINPMMLTHKKIRVRGWLEDRNGPFITLDHPLQLEMLEGGTSLSLQAPEEAPKLKTLRKPKKPQAPKKASLKLNE